MTSSNYDDLYILRRKDVEARTGLSRSTIYAKISRGEFPKPIRISERAVGWIGDEIDQYIAERIQARNRINNYLR